MEIDFRHLLPLVIIGGSFAFTGTVLYGAWLRGRYRGREDGAPERLHHVEARLERLEHVITDATSAVERLEAAQPLTVHLLSDAPVSTLRSSHRPTTPH